MGQSEVMKVLNKSKKPLTNLEITKKIGISKCNTSLRKLFDQGEIDRLKIQTLKNNRFQWFYWSLDKSPKEIRKLKEMAIARAKFE